MLSAQVPHAPSGCTAVFGPTKDAEAASRYPPEWSIHGGETSHAALHVSPEWAEVIPLALMPPCRTSAKFEAGIDRHKKALRDCDRLALLRALPPI